MTAPDVNLNKQTKRHFPVLLGLTAVVVLVGGLVLFAASLDVENDAAMQLAPASTDQN